MLARLQETALPALFAWGVFQDDIIDYFKARHLPDQILRDNLSHIASSDARSRALTSLRALRLIDADGRVLPEFKTLIEARNTGQWQVQLNLLLQTRYPYIPVHTLVQLDSAGLHAAFRTHVKRETKNLKKAEAFYLNLARASGVPLSASLKKRAATGDKMATLRSARKDLTPNTKTNSPKEKEGSVVKTDTPKGMSAQDRVEKIMDLLKMFSGEGLPAKELEAVLTLLDYAKRKAAAA